MKQRKYWIDACKALCMMAVYLVHSEVYYDIGGIDYGYILKPFYVNAFFFVSGYLFFSKYITTELTSFKWKRYRQALINLNFRLILPTIFFSTIIYIPKILFHDGTLSLEKYLFDIFGGISYWFTSALVIAQIILLTLLLFSKCTCIWFYVAASTVLFILGYILNMNVISTKPAAYFPWFYRTGLEYTFIMSLGGLYAKYERKIDPIMKSYGILICIIVYIVAIGYTWNTGTLRMMGLSGKVNAIGFFVMLCGIILCISVCKALPQKDWISYIGRNSITFYFFAGVVPAMIGKGASMLFAEKTYLITILVATCSIICGLIITKFINTYLPFLVDLRRIKQWKIKD